MKTLISSVCVLFVKAQLVAALLLNGTNAFVNFGDRSEFDNVSKISVMAWIFMDSGTAAYGGLICDLTPATAANGWGIQRNAFASDLFLSIMPSSGANAVTTAGSFPSNAWNHLAFVFDGTGAANTDRLKLWVNGVQKTLSFTGTIPALPGDNTGACYIGTFDSNVPNTFLKGTVDDLVIITGRALTQSEIDSHFKGKVRRLAAGNSHWSLDGYPDGSAVHNAAIVDDGPNQFVGMATNCVSVSSLFMSYP